MDDGRGRTGEVCLAGKAPRAQDGAHFGGSRAALISPAWFAPESALNMAVSTGGLDDAVSLFEEAAELHKVPSLVVLELNPPLMHEQLPFTWVANVHYYNEALARYGLQQRRSGDGVFSLTRLQSGLRLLTGIDWVTVRDDDPGFHILPDGSWCFPLAQRNLTGPDVDAVVTAKLRTLDPETLRWRTTSRPGPFEQTLLRRFLDDLQSRHIRVVVFLAPVHPIAYAFFRKHGGFDETWIRREMAARGITVAGSYSPLVTGATSADFFDEAHPRAPIVYRLLREAGVVETAPPALTAAAF